MPEKLEGLEDLALTAPSAEAREIALVAIAHGFTLGSLARVFNERKFSQNIVASNVKRYLAVQHMGANSIEHFAAVLGIDAEHLLASSQALPPERYEQWWRRAINEIGVADGGRFKAGTLAKLERVRATSPDIATTATHLYALASYREQHGVFKGKGRYGTGLFELSPSYRARAPELDFVKKLRSAIDLVALRKSPSTRDSALADVYQALHGLVPGETCDAIVTLCRTALVAAGHDLSEKELRLQQIVQAIKEKGT